MAMVALEGAGVWMPTLPLVFTSPSVSVSDLFILDADEEEGQVIGQVTIDGGGSKTFGLSSKIGWVVGSATITFAAGATLRVGVKKASSISTTAGPPARATIGAAAFDVYDDLAGGTDTLTALAWREETMTAGTPFTVTHGDLLAVCWHLNVTSGSPVVKTRGHGGTTNTTIVSLVTSGPLYTVQTSMPSLILVFNDGTVGWFEPTKVFSGPDTTTGAIGNGNSIANILQVPFACQIDGIAALTNQAGTGDVSLDLVGTPLGTPSILASVAVDANITGSALARILYRPFATPQTLAANTAYALSVRQTTANAVTGVYWDVANAAYFKPQGLGANCYAANSTAGATFVAQNSGLRRYLIYMRICAVDDGAGGALRTSRIPKREALRFARSRA